MHAPSDFPSFLGLAALVANAMAWALPRIGGRTTSSVRAAAFGASLLSSLALAGLSASPLLALIAAQILVTGMAALLGGAVERDLPKSRFSAEGYAALVTRQRG